MFYMMKKNK